MVGDTDVSVCLESGVDKHSNNTHANKPQPTAHATPPSHYYCYSTLLLTLPPPPLRLPCLLRAACLHQAPCAWPQHAHDHAWPGGGGDGCVWWRVGGVWGVGVCVCVGRGVFGVCVWGGGLRERWEKGRLSKVCVGGGTERVDLQADHHTWHTKVASAREQAMRVWVCTLGEIGAMCALPPPSSTPPPPTHPPPISTPHLVCVPLCLCLVQPLALVLLLAPKLTHGLLVTSRTTE